MGDGGFGRGRRDAPYPSYGSGYRQDGYGRFEEDSYQGSGFGGRYNGQGGYGGGPMRGHGGYADDYSAPMRYDGGYDSYGGYGGGPTGGYGGPQRFGNDRGFGARGGRRGGPSAGGGRGAYQGSWSM